MLYTLCRTRANRFTSPPEKNGALAETASKKQNYLRATIQRRTQPTHTLLQYRGFGRQWQSGHGRGVCT